MTEPQFTIRPYQPGDEEKILDTVNPSIREACGEDFIIGMSISYSEETPYVMTLEQLQEVIALHDATGNLDYVSCGAGNYVDYERLMATFVYGDKQGVPLAAALKSVVKHAKVTAECHIRTPENADYTIASGDSDLVSIVRGQIADPHLANKAREGRDADIRGCISCNQMCWGRRSRDYWISCLINPSAGREFEWGGDRFSRTDQPKKVLVVGAGPAGLEAARGAAARGRDRVSSGPQPEPRQRPCWQRMYRLATQVAIQLRAQHATVGVAQFAALLQCHADDRCELHIDPWVDAAHVGHARCRWAAGAGRGHGQQVVQ